MVAEQIISRVLNTSDDSIITDNMLTREYFLEFQDEFDFIFEHKEKYGNIPDKETFLAKFPEFEIIDSVNESERYLVETIREEYNYAQSVPIVQNIAKLLQTDANQAIEYMQEQSKILNPNYCLGGDDIIAGAKDRQEESKSRKENQKDWYFESGFPELDDIIHGIQRGEEFMVLVARLGQGKSWVLLKMCSHVWKTGFNVGYISPEMSKNMIGYRLDTLLGHFSNRGLMYGEDIEGYDEFIESLKNYKNKFMVATPQDFDRKITVSKLRAWIKQNKLDLIAVDGIKYLTDERGNKNDNLTTSLTNISEDLMELSVEMGIPVLVVVQANRGGVSGADEDGTPELESIRDSDGIAHNATKVISLKQKADEVLEMGIKKNRYGKMGSRLNWRWSIDVGKFEFLEMVESSQRRVRRSEDTSNKKTGNGRNVF